MSGTQHEYDGNLDFWDKAARIHGTDPSDRYYDLDKLVAGGTLMQAQEEQALAFATGADGGDPLARLAGLDVLHLQSHIGADSVVMARAGAHVTACDFSSVAVERCRELAQRVGVSIDTVVADARALPMSLVGRFDLVYATIGAHCWIDDLSAWMRSATMALRPGGRLVIVEVHPLYQVFASVQPELVADFPYGGGRSFTETGNGTYARPDQDLPSTTTNYAHSVGDEVTAAVAAGLRIEQLVEYTESGFDPRGDVLRPEPDGAFRLRVGRGPTPEQPGEPLPVLFTLIASKPTDA